MKFHANEIDAADIAGETCYLCGLTITEDDDSPCWDVMIAAPGTRFHDQPRYYHADCFSPDEE